MAELKIPNCIDANLCRVLGSHRIAAERAVSRQFSRGQRAALISRPMEDSSTFFTWKPGITAMHLAAAKLLILLPLLDVGENRVCLQAKKKSGAASSAQHLGENGHQIDIHCFPFLASGLSPFLSRHLGRVSIMLIHADS
ncbi:hypothetical protein A7C99_5927 [Trichophyton rubrum]|uniref:Uncharacterized protein n=1 Tax=Trichophyton rubrum TaxID=5551 RepID=A0A178ETX7_TRIRU|nr:hypothetical protein A7C99_5927 [Trichophyton rubrum]